MSLVRLQTGLMEPQSTKRLRDTHLPKNHICGVQVNLDFSCPFSFLDKAGQRRVDSKSKKRRIDTVVYSAAHINRLRSKSSNIRNLQY